jgi:hypothetical protein
LNSAWSAPRKPMPPRPSKLDAFKPVIDARPPMTMRPLFPPLSSRWRFPGRCYGRPRRRSSAYPPQSAGSSGWGIDGTIRATAAAFTEPTLRSLDPIHLATAQVLTNESGAVLLAFVTYDRRLLHSAKAAGLPTASPGQR